MSNKRKQSTLFQSWGGESQSVSAQKSGDTKAKKQKVPTASRPRETEDPDGPITLQDSDDEALACALEESLANYLIRNSAQSGQDTVTDHNECNVSFGIEEQDTEHSIDRSNCLSQWNATDMPVEELRGYDPFAGKRWIYPTNYPVREYQFDIVRQGLVKNTLVTLPTGLGKTFIASVVMYNFYRWYPEGKVVFMAPTKPLVAQQIEACYNIMGIPREDTAEMTGSMAPTERHKAWRDRRVFFLTPQVMINDLSRGTCIPDAVKCLVIDEAHKALGNHAYCQVVRELVKYTRQFRVLALSATPGSDIKAVQNVISNLLISHIELRSEDSPDIQPYTHERTVDKIVVPLGEELSRIKLKYFQILQLVATRLIHNGVLFGRAANSLLKYHVLQAREAFRNNPPPSLPTKNYGMVECDFSLAMTLCHGYQLLQQHGLRSLLSFLEGVVSGSKSRASTRSELMKNADFTEIMEFLNKKFQDSGPEKPTFEVGHPKLIKLQEVVLEHFHEFEAAGQPTRVMIFSQFRDSVQEITSMLQLHRPLVKVMSFIGQSSAGKATKGFTQKEQLKVMQAFRTGGYNTLVSTCVGEEGLDIGEVDLIVCYDASKSPIRLVQRMGRTGRKRQGRIVMLLTEGREEQIYNQSQYTKRSIHRAIRNGAKSLVFYANNCRMIPANITPVCHRMHITVQAKPQLADKPKGHKRKSTLPTDAVKAKAAKKDKHEEAGITLDEFETLKSVGCVLTACTVGHALGRPAMLTLDTRLQHTADEEDSREMNMAEWLPWQNSLQDTSHFGHNPRSRHLVELLEFTDLQQMLSPEEDNYGHEMKIYLDMDDIPSDQKRPVSNDITQFIVPSQKNKSSVEGEGAEKSKKQRKKGDLAKKVTVTTKKNPKHIIQAIEVSEENSDDSDSLPEVDFPWDLVSRQREVAVSTSADCDEGPSESGVASTRHTKRTAQRQEAESVPVTSVPSYDNAVNNNTVVWSGYSVQNTQNTVGQHGQPFRVPPPPPIEEISRLVNLIEPENWVNFNVDGIVRNNFVVPLSLTVPLRSPPHLDDSSEWDFGISETDHYGTPPSIIRRDRVDATEQETKDESAPETEDFSPVQDPDFDEESTRFGSRNVQAPLQSGLAQSGLKCESAHHFRAGDSTPGQKQNQSDIETVKAPGAGEEFITDSSVLYRDFLDDDEDFELQPRSPNQTVKRNLKPSVCHSRVQEVQIPGPCVNATSVSMPAAPRLVRERATTCDGNNRVTFTQALALVHDQSASDSGHSDPSKVYTQGAQNIPAIQATAKTLSKPNKEDLPAAHQDEGLSIFDLRFDFDEDEDIILPSPEAETPSVSQLAVKCVSQPSVKSVTCDMSAENDQKNTGGVSNENSAGVDDFDKDDKLLDLVEEDRDKSLSLGFQPTEVTGTRMSNFLSPVAITSDNVHKQSVVSEDGIDAFDLPKIRKRKHALNSKDQRHCSAPKKIASFKDIASRFQAKSLPSQETKHHEESEEFSSGRTSNAAQGRSDKLPSLRRNDHSPGSDSRSLAFDQPQLKLSSIGASHQSEDVQFDGRDLFTEDFASISDNESEIESNPQKLFTGCSPREKSPVRSQREGAHVFCSTPVHSKKTDLDSGRSVLNRTVSASTSARKRPAFSLDLEDDDFEESTIQTRKKFKKVGLLSPDKMDEELDNVGKKQKKTLAKKQKLKCRFNFLDNEAELSGDMAVSSDESEENTETLEGSFIDNCTQLTQSSQIDMQAVYMKSVRSPIHQPGLQRGKYRLQLKPVSVDVYSQLPSHLEEESEYQEDSFCVGSEEEESSYGDSEVEETTKLVTAHKRKKQQAVKQVKGRKRIRQLADSSSDEEDGLHRMPPSQIRIELAPVKAGLSSSDEAQEILPADITTSPEKSGPVNQDCNRGSKFSPTKSLPEKMKFTKTTDSMFDDNPFDREYVSSKFSSKADETKGEDCKERRLSTSNKDLKPSALELVLPSEESSPFLDPVQTCSSEMSSPDLPISSTLTSFLPPAPVLPILSALTPLENKVSLSLTSLLPPVPSALELVLPSEQSSPFLDPVQTRSCEMLDLPISSTLTSFLPPVPVTVTSDGVNKLTSESRSPDCVSVDVLARSSAQDIDSFTGDRGGSVVQCDVMGHLFLPPENQGSSSACTYIESSKLLANKEHGKLGILVDSREISGAQDILSSLKLDHSACISVRQLAACDYVVSNRMAVMRITWSSFCSLSNRNKLMNRLKLMQSLYDRCVVIAEADRVKPGEEKKNKTGWSCKKHVESLKACICQTSMRLFFTNNQGETASLIAQLTAVEFRKGMAITAPLDLTLEQEKVVKFYESLPFLSVAHALNLRFNFRTLKDFMISSVKDIQIKGHMSVSRATDVVNFLIQHISVAACSNKSS